VIKVPAADQADGRTWLREGNLLLPPAGTTAEQRFAACCAWSAARFGFGANHAPRRSVLRVLRQTGGVTEQVRFTRRGERGDVAVRVYGGCRAD
jgi:hypothetical protein